MIDHSSKTLTHNIVQQVLCTKPEKMRDRDRKSGGPPRAYLGQPRQSYSPAERYIGRVWGSSHGGRYWGGYGRLAGGAVEEEESDGTGIQRTG